MNSSSHILLLLGLSVSMMLAGCRSWQPVSSTAISTSSRTDSVFETIYVTVRDTIVDVELPLQASESHGLSDTSSLETDYAISLAWYDGYLHHFIWNKPLISVRVPGGFTSLEINRTSHSTEISSSNTQEIVKSSRFGEDFFYRLGVVIFVIGLLWIILKLKL